MSCQACEAAVSSALADLPGVTGVTVDLESKLVRVDHDRGRTALPGLRSALEDQGYEVTGWEER
jgi:copper chaperone CopZ